jgi:hypothetical protein
MSFLTADRRMPRLLFWFVICTCTLRAEISAGDDTTGMSIQSEISAARQRHRIAIGRISKNPDPAPDELEKANRQLAESLRALVKHANASPIVLLTTAELCAVAECAEALKEYHTSLQFGNAAIDREPGDERGYFLVARSHLNLDDVESVEKLLYSNASQFANHSPFWCIHGLVSAKRERRGDLTIAAYHLDRFIVHALHGCMSQSLEGVPLAHHLRRLKALSHQSGLEALFQARLANYEQLLLEQQYAVAGNYRHLPPALSLNTQLAFYDCRMTVATFRTNSNCDEVYSAWMKCLCRVAGSPHGKNFVEGSLERATSLLQHESRLWSSLHCWEGSMQSLCSELHFQSGLSRSETDRTTLRRLVKRHLALCEIIRFRRR